MSHSQKENAHQRTLCTWICRKTRKYVKCKLTNAPQGGRGMGIFNIPWYWMSKVSGNSMCVFIASCMWYLLHVYGIQTGTRVRVVWFVVNKHILSHANSHTCCIPSPQSTCFMCTSYNMYIWSHDALKNVHTTYANTIYACNIWNDIHKHIYNMDVATTCMTNVYKPMIVSEKKYKIRENTGNTGTFCEINTYLHNIW